MKISGFTFSRNAEKLYYPVAESIRSILPICDEFVVALGRGDDDDGTRAAIKAIGDPRITIIDTEWTDRERLKGRIHSQQTNIALERCTGDWCFYLQADEVVHERYLPVIQQRCEELLEKRRVDGLLFRYKHFWGDYDHYIVSHKWYPQEIRIIRNHLGITSHNTAQSFRCEGKRLRVAPVDAEIFHYGWVRPPRLMAAKQKEFQTTHRSREWLAQQSDAALGAFSYGSLEELAQYDGNYPGVMRDRIAGMDWRDQLQYTGPSPIRLPHERLKYRMLTWLEQTLFGGRVHLGKRGWHRAWFC